MVGDRATADRSRGAVEMRLGSWHPLVRPSDLPTLRSRLRDRPHRSDSGPAPDHWAPRRHHRRSAPRRTVHLLGASLSHAQAPHRCGASAWAAIGALSVSFGSRSEPLAWTKLFASPDKPGT